MVRFSVYIFVVVCVFCIVEIMWCSFYEESSFCVDSPDINSKVGDIFIISRANY